MSATASAAVGVTVNGQPRELAEGWTIARLVAELAPEARMVAVERNGEIVPRRRWAETVIVADDRIEIVRFVQGG